MNNPTSGQAATIAFNPPSWGNRPRLQKKWDWRAAANFIAGGGAGAMLAFIAALATSNLFLIASTFFALALMGLGLACILLKMGHPFRALYTFKHVQTSWMTREVLTVPLVFGFGAAAMWWPEQHLFSVAAAVAGLAFLYCQAQILFAAKGIPAWSVPQIVALTILTGVAEGAGFFAAAVAVLDTALLFPAAVVLLASLAARQVAWGSYRRAAGARKMPKKSMEVIDGIGRFLLPFGQIVPMLLAAVALALVVSGNAMVSLAPVLLGAGGLLAALGGWVLKFNLITRGGYTHGFQLPAKAFGR